MQVQPMRRPLLHDEVCSAAVQHAEQVAADCVHPSHLQGTLEEAVTADLLLHVVDAAAPDADAQHATVVSILRQLGMTSTQLAKKVGASKGGGLTSNSPLQRLQCVDDVLPACQDST
jgi:hypothetical protein